MALNNSKNLVSVRKKLRNYSTPYERKLWFYLKNNKMNKYKFRRQHSIGKYILDFYCPKIKLAIELDGRIHTDDAVFLNDSEKEAFLMKKGITVIRFGNIDIIKNLEGVLNTIRTTLSLRDIPPRQGGNI
ncbi:MAG: endonuclease domain-containing protein [bacterium]